MWFDMKRSIRFLPCKARDLRCKSVVELRLWLTMDFDSRVARQQKEETGTEPASIL